MVDFGEFKTFVVADIPGLIEGASEGAGLGDRFLRHVERTKLILHLVDVSSISGRNPVEDYEIINRELANYDVNLSNRPQIVVATKLDALDEPERLENLREAAEKDGKQFMEISAVTNRGTQELVFAVAQRLEEMKKAEEETKKLEINLTEPKMFDEKFEDKMHDGSRHFVDMPEVVFFDEVSRSRRRTRRRGNYRIFNRRRS